MRAASHQRTSRRAVVVAAADNKAAAGFAAAALAAAILVNAPMAKADLVRTGTRWGSSTSLAPQAMQL